VQKNTQRFYMRDVTFQLMISFERCNVNIFFRSYALLTYIFLGPCWCQLLQYTDTV